MPKFKRRRLCRQSGIRLPEKAAGESLVAEETDKSLISKPLSGLGDEGQA
jgi:hypothetical protein